MIRRAHGDERGQALVEFSLVLPIVLLLLLGILQVGLILNARQTVENAARIAADAYARTLSTAEADSEAVRAADQLRPRLVPPVGTIDYAVIGATRVEVCVRRTWLRCLERTTRSVRNERRASAADRGKVGELVRATIRYDYPLPVGGLARFGFPTRLPLTGEAISLIEATAPAPEPARSTCYEVVRTFDTFGNPVDLSATVNGSPAARVRAMPGADVDVEVVASPGQALRQYGLGAQTVRRDLVRVTESGAVFSTDRSVSWTIGSSTVSYRVRPTVTLRPAADGSCGPAQ